MRCIYHGGAASRKLEANIYRSQLRQVALARSSWKRGEEGGGGGASEPKRFTREEGEGSNETMVFIFSLRQSEQPLSGKSFGVGALFIIVAGRHKRRECGKRRKTRVR